MSFRGDAGLLLAQNQIDNKTASHMRARAAKVTDDGRVLAAGHLQGGGQFRHPVEYPVIVDSPGEGDDVWREPGERGTTCRNGLKISRRKLAWVVCSETSAASIAPLKATSVSRRLGTQPMPGYLQTGLLPPSTLPPEPPKSKPDSPPQLLRALSPHGPPTSRYRQQFRRFPMIASPLPSVRHPMRCPMQPPALLNRPFHPQTTPLPRWRSCFARP